MSDVPYPVALHDFVKSNGLKYEDTCTVVEGPSLTRQEFAEECDINSLMARYDTHVHGGPGGLPPMEPMYFDWADMPQTLMEFMKFQDDAAQQFMRLPAVVRKEFDNSPIEFVAFASDPGNLEQMRSWGLAPPAKVNPAPAVVAEASPAPAPPPAAPPAGTSQGAS